MRSSWLLVLLSGCATPVPLPESRTIDVREVRFFRDDEFKQEERQFRTTDAFRVQLTEELVLRKFVVSASRVGLTVSLSRYHDLLRGDVLMSEAQVGVDGKKSVVIRHNAALELGLEAAIAQLARLTAQELADKIVFRR